MIAHEIAMYEQERVANESTYWLYFELLWREYFHHLALYVGHRLFTVDGIQQRERRWHQNEHAFSRWCLGMTGHPSSMHACANWQPQGICRIVVVRS